MTTPHCTRKRNCTARCTFCAVALAVLVAASSSTISAQQNSDLDRYFSQNVGLNQTQIAAIRNGQPVAKTLPSRTPDEVFLFGAIYVKAAPEQYVQFAHDYNRLRKLPGNLALGVFSGPPTLSDLKGFMFDNDDIKALKDCKPGHCLIGLPENLPTHVISSIMSGHLCLGNWHGVKWMVHRW